MHNPIITVAIPFYNEEKFLEQAIRSVLEQTVKNITIILSDNNSTDSSYTIASNYAKTDSRIKLIKHQTNIGAIANFTYSRDICETKYFMWLGAHDIIAPDYIDILLNKLEENESYKLVFSKSVLIDINNKEIGGSGSDIDTQGLPFKHKLYKIARNLVFADALHGIYRSETIKKIPFLSTLGSDHLVLFATACYGDLVEIDYKGYFRRQVRHESPEEIIKRHESFKMFKSNRYFNPRIEMAENHYLFLLRNNLGIGFFQKLKMIYRLHRIFSDRFEYGHIMPFLHILKPKKQHI